MQLIDVDVIYTDGTQALHRINLRLGSGEQLALIGPSGSGKSTLLRLMSLSLAPSDGTVTFESVNPWQLRTSRLHRLRRCVHLCPQSAPLVIRQRVLSAVLAGLLPTRSLGFALKSLVSPAKVDVALVYSLLNRLGVGQHLWRPVDALSGGQRQRVAIARAMVSESQYLFLDEPLSALDPISSEETLVSLLQDATDKHRAIVCSLHQVELARSHFARIIGLRDGRVLFDSPAPDVSDTMIDTLYRGHEAELDAQDTEDRQDSRGV